MRHGQAESSAPSDELRALTQLGIKEASSNSQSFLSNKVFDYVFVSPYLRAQQTWEIVSKQNVQSKSYQTVDWVTPDVDTQPILDHLLALEGESLSILLVCHQTFAGRLATHLCGGAKHGIHVDTAAILHIETEVFAGQCGTLINIYPN
jgi:phosphohistidine phosphatase